jgi:hypothetical protein
VVAENDVGVIQRVERLTLDGGASEPVFTFDFEPSTVTSVDVSGDGTRIVCSVLTDERDLAIVDVASAAPQ